MGVPRRLTTIEGFTVLPTQRLASSDSDAGRARGRRAHLLHLPRQPPHSAHEQFVVEVARSVAEFSGLSTCVDAGCPAGSSLTTARKVSIAPWHVRASAGLKFSAVRDEVFAWHHTDPLRRRQ